MQKEALERNFDEERKMLKTRISELEKNLEIVTHNLGMVESTLNMRNAEVDALQINFKELEELRELKEVSSFIILTESKFKYKLVIPLLWKFAN